MGACQCTCEEDATSLSDVLTRLSRCLLLQNQTRTTSLSSRSRAARYAICADDGFGWVRKCSSNASLALRPIVVRRFRLLSVDPTYSRTASASVNTFMRWSQDTTTIRVDFDSTAVRRSFDDHLIAYGPSAIVAVW